MSRGCCALQVSPRSVPGRCSCCPQCPLAGGPRGFHSSPPLSAPPRLQPLRAPNSPRAWPMRQPFIPWQLLVWYPRALWANQGQGQGQAKALLGLLLVLKHRRSSWSLGQMPGQCLQQHVYVHVYVCVHVCVLPSNAILHLALGCVVYTIGA